MPLRSLPAMYLWVPVILVSIGLAFAIAHRTSYNTHPDERSQSATFCYYLNYWWPPEIGSDLVVYSKHGRSRVFEGEFVYLLYGRISAVIRDVSKLASDTLNGKQPELMQRLTNRYAENDGCFYKVYRYLNATLYAGLLFGLFMLSRRHNIAHYSLGLLVGIPQVTYIFAYANSDAWGLSASLALFLFAFTRQNFRLTPVNAVFLAALTSLVLLSKNNYWAALPLPYLILLVKLLEEKRDSWRHNLKMSALVVGLTLVLIAPGYIIYPLSQGDYHGKIMAEREARAVPGLRPSDTSNPNVRMAARGVPFSEMLTSLSWYENSARSFYALFGWMNQRAADEVYLAALLLGIAALAAVLAGSLWRGWNASRLQQMLLMAAFGTIVLSLLASMYYSWAIDFQAQGRYLFSAIPALAYLLHFATETFFARRPLLAIMVVGVMVWLTWWSLIQAVLFNQYFIIS